MLQLIIDFASSFGSFGGEYMDSDTMGQLLNNVVEAQSKCDFKPLDPQN
ncbi:hypothetical protein [Sphingobacterium faecale]|uniref:Uncharacterized protein n=1 Tax=Sphingobacterium faecale TaxID=2803775 RepID=A0ABS1R6M9_9SPHI|nr:hypothetical protein [Sphingobacterium faecale]MBL1410375.1 hypothetical protein [Sphingobacterium faecale]